MRSFSATLRSTNEQLYGNRGDKSISKIKCERLGGGCEWWGMREKVPSFTVPCLGKLQRHTTQTPQEGLLLLYNSQNLLSWFILQPSLHTGSWCSSFRASGKAVPFEKHPFRVEDLVVLSVVRSVSHCVSLHPKQHPSVALMCLPLQ